jgi:hypothetical protein
MSDREQIWYTPLLVFCLVAIALLGALAGRRDDTQTFGAILAVFFGAVTMLRSELGPWFREPDDTTRTDVELPLNTCGVLVIAVGAAFLLS